MSKLRDDVIFLLEDNYGGKLVSRQAEAIIEAVEAVLDYYEVVIKDLQERIFKLETKDLSYE